MPQLTDSFLKLKILRQKEEMWMGIIPESIMLIVIHTVL